MTLETKIAIDNKITELGKSGCLDFLYKTNINPAANWSDCRNIRRAIRSELAAEDWDGLTNLFLGWKIA